MINRIQLKKAGFQNLEQAKESFLATEWGCLQTIKRLDLYLTAKLLDFEDELKSAIKKYGLTISEFTLDKFYQICAAENIKVTRYRIRGRKSAVGSYVYHRETGEKEIWLHHSLEDKNLLYTAAHELAHFFLHTEKIKAGMLLTPLNRQMRREQEIKIIMAEIEADFLACLFLTQSEVRND